MTMIEKTYPITEKLIDKSLSLSQRLYGLLSKEAENLRTKSSPETLASLANSKKEVVEQMEQLSKQLSQVMATEKLLLSQTDIKRYFEIASSAGLSVSNCLNHWKQLTEISKKCQLLNEQNGAGIALLIRHNQRAMQLLRGKSQTATTYGPDGSTNSERFSQSLFSV